MFFNSFDKKRPNNQWIKLIKNYLSLHNIYCFTSAKHAMQISAVMSVYSCLCCLNCTFKNKNMKWFVLNQTEESWFSRPSLCSCVWACVSSCCGEHQTGFSSLVHRDGSFSQLRHDVLIFTSLGGRSDTDWDESARSLIDERLDTEPALFPSIVCWHFTGLKTGNLPQKHTHTASSPNTRDEDEWKCFQNDSFRTCLGQIWP